jgi:hypothetical protein
MRNKDWYAASQRGSYGTHRSSGQAGGFHGGRQAWCDTTAYADRNSADSTTVRAALARQRVARRVGRSVVVPREGWLMA